MAVAGGPAPAEICYSGTWVAKFHTIETPDIDLQYPAGFSNCSTPADLKTLGISFDQPKGGKAAVTFELQREAGTFACSGEAGDGVAEGTFRFFPSAEWTAAIDALGLRCSLSDQLIAAMADLPLSYVRGIIDAGYKPTSLNSFLGLKMTGITVEHARTLWSAFPDADYFSIISLAGMFKGRVSEVHILHEAFPDASLEEIRLLTMSRATPQLIAALRSLRVRDMSAANVTALRSIGVDEAYIEQLAASGKTGLTIDEIVVFKRGGL